MVFDIPILFILILVFTALGRRVFKFAGMEFSSFVEEVVFSFGLGAGIVALLTLGIGFLGGLKRWVFYILTFGLLGVLILDVKYMVLGAVRWIRAKRARLQPLEIVLLVILGLHFLLTLFGALAPQMEWDSLGHHLTVSKIYIQNDRIFNMSPTQGWFVGESNYPSNMEMLFMLGMLLRSDVLATLIAWSVAAFLALSVYSFSRCHELRSPTTIELQAGMPALPGHSFSNEGELTHDNENAFLNCRQGCLRSQGYFQSRQSFSIRTGLIAMSIVYCSSIVSVHATFDTVDLGVAFFGLLALYAAFRWIHSADYRFLIFSGVYAGFCAGTKYTGVPVILVLGFLILLLSVLERKRFVPGFGYILLFGLIALAAASPWYIKNYVFTGNPVYPFFAKILGGRNLPPGVAGHCLSTPWKGLDDYKSWYNMLLGYMRFPWDLTMMRSEYARAPSIGPLYLIFIPCLIFVRNVDRKIKYLLFYGLFGLTIVFGVAQQTRYMFPFIVPLAVVAAYSIYRICGGDEGMIDGSGYARIPPNPPLVKGGIDSSLVKGGIDTPLENCEKFHHRGTENTEEGRRKMILLPPILGSGILPGDSLLKGVSIFILVAAMVFNILMLLNITSIKAPVVMGIESRRDYLSKVLTNHEAVLYINENLPDSSRVMSFDPRVYYCNVPCVYDGAVMDYGAFQDDEMRMLEELKRLNISHVLLSWNSPTFGGNPGAVNLYRKLIEQGKLRGVFGDSNSALYVVTVDSSMQLESNTKTQYRRHGILDFRFQISDFRFQILDSRWVRFSRLGTSKAEHCLRQ